MEQCENARTQKATKRKAESLTNPAKPKAPISLTSPERIKLTLKNYRTENTMLKQDIEKLNKEIQKSSLPVTSDLNTDMKSLMS